jgi:hypothetical protein
VVAAAHGELLLALAAHDFYAEIAPAQELSMQPAAGWAPYVVSHIHGANVSDISTNGNGFACVL